MLNWYTYTYMCDNVVMGCSMRNTEKAGSAKWIDLFIFAQMISVFAIAVVVQLDVIV